MFTSLFVVLLSLISANQPCKKIRVRPEIRDLNNKELTRFVKAVKEINSGPRPTKFDKIVDIHIKNFRYCHGASEFLVWHREYIREFEKLLQTVDSEIDLPYWDWSADFSDPASSKVLKEILGGNGVGKDMNVTGGMFGNWTVANPHVHILQREYDLGDKVGPFYSTKSLMKMIKESKTFSSLSDTIESLPHATVHMNVAGRGDMNFEYSSNDILFYLHHTFVDLIYWEWQQQHSNISNTYNGYNWENNDSKTTDTLTPFGTKIADTLDTKGHNYCYTYHRLGSKKYTKEIQPSEDGAPRKKFQLTSLSSESTDSANVINTPRRASTSWLERNGLNVTLVRELEKKFRGPQ